MGYGVQLFTRRLRPTPSSPPTLGCQSYKIRSPHSFLLLRGDLRHTRLAGSPQIPLARSAKLSGFTYQYSKRFERKNQRCSSNQFGWIYSSSSSAMLQELAWVRHPYCLLQQLLSQAGGRVSKRMTLFLLQEALFKIWSENAISRIKFSWHDWPQAAKQRGGTARLPKTPQSQGEQSLAKTAGRHERTAKQRRSQLLTSQNIPSFKAEIPWRPARGILLASHRQQGPGQSLAHRQQAFQSLLRTCEASGFSQVILPARCHLLASPVHGLG